MNASGLSRLLATISATALATGLLAGTAPAALASDQGPASDLPEVTSSGDSTQAGAEGPRRTQKVWDLAGGICATSLPEGLVRFDGPSGTKLVARVRRTGQARLLTVISGSGRIGGVALRPKDATGEVVWSKGRMTGSVTIALSDHAKVSRSWAQDVTVTASPQGCGWSATVQLAAKGVGASLDLRGPLEKDGSYELRGSGSVSINKTRVPVTGWLRAANRTGAAWRIAGQTSRSVRMGGADLDGIRLSLTDATPVAVGTANLHLEVPRLTATTRLAVLGADSWKATVVGSNRRAWVVPQADGLVARTAELEGSIGVRSGQQQWLLQAPGAVSIGTLDYSVQVGFAGPATYTVQATGARGSILNTVESRPFAGVATKLTIGPRGITGALTVASRGNLLLAMDGDWTNTTDYILRPVSGAGWSFDTYLSAAMRAGNGTMRLSGPVSPSGGVSLVASGTMDVSGTLVPVRGYYRRDAFRADVEPVWALAADLGGARGGRIPLDGGAGLVGGMLTFRGPGSQPVSTIPASSARIAAPRDGGSLTTIAYEPFAYGSGGLGGKNGGSGWTGSWVKTYGSGGNYQVNTGGMTYPGLAAIGGRVVWGKGGNDINGFGRTLPRVDSGEIYLQFLSNMGSQTGGGTPTIRLIDTSTGVKTGAIGNSGAPTMAILDSGLVPIASSTTSMNGKHLTVVRIDYGARTTSMWIDPDLATFDYWNPPTPQAQATNFAPAFSRIDPYVRNGATFDEISVLRLGSGLSPGPVPMPMPEPVTVTGTTTVQLSTADDDTFLLPVDYIYTDDDNWTATAAGTTPDNLYNPYTGLQVPETDFSGTVTSVDGVETWDVSIAMQEWQDMARGVDYKGSFTISNDCPLADSTACPDAEGIFVGGDATLVFDDTAIPTVYANGGFLTDLTWARWEATATGSAQFGDVTMSNPDLTIWRGQGGGGDPRIVMPDLSDLNGNDLNLEFCANFLVPVPDVATISTLGCAAWSQDGAVVAQVNTGGSIETDDYNGVTVNSTTLTGYVYNGVERTETVFLNGTNIEAEPDRNYVTADIAVPGNVMHDFGTGSSSDAVISAVGWFDAAGDFDIQGTIPVHLSGSGFTLEQIVIGVSRDGSGSVTDFQLRFDAECDVVVKGNHFPLDVYIGYRKATDTTITVGLSATGTQSTQASGTMDFVNLLPAGDFEPTNPSIVDGSFDGALPANAARDGGFERAIDPGDLIADGGFEAGMGLNALDGGDFEDGYSGNLLPNGDFESTNLLVNGDFEEFDGYANPNDAIVGWLTSNGNFGRYLTSGSAVGAEESGSTIAVLYNNNVSNNTTQGLTQTVPLPLNGYEVSLSAWVSSDNDKSAPFHIYVQSNGCSTNFKGQSVTAVKDTWVQATASGSLGQGCESVTVTLVPEAAGTRVRIDAVEMTVTSVKEPSTLPTVYRPGVVGTFDSLDTTPLMPGYSGGVSVATDYPGTLRTNGGQAWMFGDGNIGWTPDDFDVSYKVMFPTGSNDREIADFGFWLDSNYNSMSGYCFRLQTANGDGGFYGCRRNSFSADAVPGKSRTPDVTRGHWYQVRLTAVGPYVTAYVTDLTTNRYFWSQTLKLNTVPGGVFGQVPDGRSSPTGIRWDDFTIHSLANARGNQAKIYGSSQVWVGDGAHSGQGRASLYSRRWSGVPFEYSTGEAPEAGSAYTYSAWLRAPKGTVSGSLSLQATGGASEISRIPFSVGGAWTKVSVTLDVAQGGHDDLRPRITLDTTNAELQVDDLTLQEVPWQVPGANSTDTMEYVTTDEAHGGIKSAALVSDGNGSTVTKTFPRTGVLGEDVTFSTWVKSPAGVNGQVRIQEQSGSTTKPFTATGEWQQVSVTRRLQGGDSDLYVAIDTGGGQAGKVLYFDDAEVTSTRLASDQPDGIAVPPVPEGWTGTLSGEPITPVVMSDADTAHTGQGALRLQAVNGNTSTVYRYAVEATPQPGSTWVGSVWAMTPGGSAPANLTLSVLTDKESVAITRQVVPGEMTQISVPLDITKTGAGQLMLTIQQDRADNTPVFVDDASLTAAGLQPVDPWQLYAPYGFVSIEDVIDSAAAARGTGYLSVHNTGSDRAGLYLDDTIHPVANTEHELSFWARTPSGTAAPVGAWLRTFDADGATLDSYSLDLTITDTWQPYFISLPIKDTRAVRMRTEIGIPGGATVYLDDLQTRDIPTWTAVRNGGPASIAIVDNARDAVDGQAYLRMAPSGSGGGMGTTVSSDMDGKAISVKAGETYRMQAYVRSYSGATSGTMSLTSMTGGSSVDTGSVSFTATSDWTLVELTLTATAGANALMPRVILKGAGVLDVDALSVTPLRIQQDDPWTSTGSGVSWQVMDDPADAHDRSYGVMELTVGDADTGITHAVDYSASTGDQLSATAFVRSASGAPMTGRVQVTSRGGDNQTWQTTFTAGTDWQLITVPIEIAKSGIVGFDVAVLVDTIGELLYVDDVALQANPWTPNSSVRQVVAYDGSGAQSGSGYLQLTPTGGGTGSSFIDMPASADLGGSYAAGSTWIGTAYVRSSVPGTLATGSISLGAPGDTLTSRSYSVGSEWTEVPVSFTVGGAPLGSLRVQVGVSGSSVPVDVDSVTIADSSPTPDGITTPLPHPQSGWVYLWDDAFGIPGSHLWAISAQVEFRNGLPGLGVSATTYQDPTRMPNVMSGTDWIKGDMALNISEADPCFLFEFSSGGGNSGVSLGTGVFQANSFALSFAPRGCEVGPYVVPRGAALSFDGDLGDGSVAFAIAITYGDGGPEFDQDIGITDITIGGIDFKEMSLGVHITPVDYEVSFVGNMVLPMGNFYGSYDLSANSDALIMDGAVSVTDWDWAGGGFNVEEFTYDMHMAVPFGAGQCGSFDTSTSGKMEMAKKTGLDFNGRLAVDCGRLQILHLDYDYKHGAITQKFNLDYNSSTGILSGGVGFQFERSTSWKFWLHRYSRHPYFAIELDYSMNVRKPSTASATLTGTVSVSGGDGSISCTISPGSGSSWADDRCSLHVHLNIGGGHTYDASW